MKRKLKSLSEHHGYPSSKQIKPQINCDGLPISKSTGLQLSLLLGYVENFKGADPFVIGIYAGTSKPEISNVFLKQFVDEYLEIASQGIQAGGSKISVVISSIICDAPARSFVLNTKGHTGYFGCGKCTQEGDFVKKERFFLTLMLL